MKLASLKHGRDGKLILVSRDLEIGVDATDIDRKSTRLNSSHRVKSRIPS